MVVYNQAVAIVAKKLIGSMTGKIFVILENLYAVRNTMMNERTDLEL